MVHKDLIGSRHLVQLPEEALARLLLQGGTAVYNNLCKEGICGRSDHAPGSLCWFGVGRRCLTHILRACHTRRACICLSVQATGILQAATDVGGGM